MTFVGKVLVVANLALGICLMMLAGAVSSVQINWKAEAEQLKQSLGEEKKLVEQKDDALETEKLTAAERLQQVVNERDALQQELDRKLAGKDDLVKEIEGYKKQLNEAKLREKLAEDASVLTDSQAEELKVAVNKLTERQNELFKANLELEKERGELEKQVRALNEAYQDQLVRYKEASDLLAYNGIDPNAPAKASDPIPVYDVDGKVLKVQIDNETDRTYVQINLGSDDTLLEGHILHLIRTEGRVIYLGKIRLVKLFPDYSVGVVVSQTRNTTIKEGDDVTTKIGQF